MTAPTVAARLLERTAIPATVAACAAMIADRPDRTLTLFAALGYLALALLLSLTAQAPTSPQLPLFDDPFTPDADSAPFAIRVHPEEH